MITLHVPAELRLPVGGVRTRSLSMFRAGVPEATVNEDCYATASEYDVRAHATTGGCRRQVNAESPAATMQRRALATLRGGIAPTVCTHGGRGRGTRRLRVAWLHRRLGRASSHEALALGAGDGKREQWRDGIADLLKSAAIRPTDPEPSRCHGCRREASRTVSILRRPSGSRSRIMSPVAPDRFRTVSVRAGWFRCRSRGVRHPVARS